MLTVSVVIPVYRVSRAKGVSGCTAAKLIRHAVNRFTNRNRKIITTLVLPALQIRGATKGRQCYHRGRL